MSRHLRSDGSADRLHWATCSCGWASAAHFDPVKVDVEWFSHRSCNESGVSLQVGTGPSTPVAGGGLRDLSSEGPARASLTKPASGPLQEDE